MTAWLPSVRLATTANLAANGFGFILTPTTLDGVGVNAGDEILAKDQTNPIQNGTWIADATPGVAMARRADTFEPESTVRVSEGDVNGHTLFVLATRVPVAGTTPLRFVSQSSEFVQCRAASTGNVTIPTPATLTIDAVTLVPGDRVLLKDQTTTSQNGVYLVNDDGDLERFGDPDGPATTVRVDSGTANRHTRWSRVVNGATIRFARQSIRTNILDFGAVGDGMTDDFDAFDAAVDTIPSSGGVLVLPQGTYLIGQDKTIPAYVQVVFEGGASVAPTGATLTIEGRVTSHAKQAIFAGTGQNGAVVPDAGNTSPLITVSGTPAGTYSPFAVQITGATKFQYQLDGVNWSEDVTIATTVEIPRTNLTLGFPAGVYVNGDSYSWDSFPPVVLGPTSLDKFDVLYWGAQPDWDWGLASGADNLHPFQSALAAMEAAGSGGPGTNGFNRGAPLFIDGQYFLSNTLHLRHVVMIEGASSEEPWIGSPGRSGPGSMLVFPTNVDGIRLHSNADGHGGGADGSQIRNLNVWCMEIRPPYYEGDGAPAAAPPDGKTGHGIHANCRFSMVQCNVRNFAEHGIFINALGVGAVSPIELGNATGSLVSECVISLSGGDGIHTLGGDAHSQMVKNCNFTSNWGWGVWDESTIGSTYIGCIGQGNLGDLWPPSTGYSVDGAFHDYKSGDTIYSETNASTFLGCYQEESLNSMGPNSGAIGGGLGQGSHDSGNLGFYLSSGGVVSCAPLVYEFRDPANPGVIITRTEIGNPAAPDRAFTVNRSDRSEPSWLIYRTDIDWWEWQNQAPTRAALRFPTVKSNIRTPAAWFPNGVLLGRDDLITDRAGLVFTAAPLGMPLVPPDNMVVGAGYPQTYEAGDVILQSDAPVIGAPLGIACVTKGTQTTLAANNTDMTVMIGDPSIHVDDPAVTATADFQPGQYIVVDGNVYKITSVTPDGGAPDPLRPGTLGIAPNALTAIPNPSVVTFQNATFVNIGEVGATGQVELDVTVAPNPLGYDIAQYKMLKVTGAPMATVAIDYPAPPSDEAAYERIIRNISGQQLDVNIAGGVNPPVPIPNGSIVRVAFDTVDAFAVP